MGSAALPLAPALGPALPSCVLLPSGRLMGDSAAVSLLFLSAELELVSLECGRGGIANRLSRE